MPDTVLTYKQTAQRVIESINQHELSELDDLLSERFVTHTPGLSPEANRDEMRDLYGSMLKAFPDLHYTIEAEVAQRDAVVYRLRGDGTHLGEIFGVAASGEKAAWQEIHIFKFGDDGRIVEHWGLSDSASIMMQLGRMPPVELW